MSINAQFRLCDYVNAAGKSPIELHITGNSQSARVQLDLEIDTKYFDCVKQRGI